MLQFWLPLCSKPQKLVSGSCQACRVKDAAWFRFNSARMKREEIARCAGKQRAYELRREMWLKGLGYEATALIEPLLL
jgi:hypothetical protein